MATGVLSNVYARILDRPAAVTRVPAMMLLVPGGLGFLSLSSLMEQDVLKGLQTAFSVAVMAVAMVMMNAATIRRTTTTSFIAFLPLLNVEAML